MTYVKKFDESSRKSIEMPDATINKLELYSCGDSYNSSIKEE